MAAQHNLSPEQEAEIIQLLEWAEENNANQGIECELWDIAKALDWSVSTLDRVKKVIRMNPSLGITFMVKRGRERLVIIAWDNEWLSDPALVDEARGMAVGEREENFGRIIRSSSTLVTAYNNTRPKTRSEARLLRAEKWIIEDLLLNIRSFGRRYGHDKLVNETEQILSIAGHSFSDDEDDE